MSRRSSTGSSHPGSRGEGGTVLHLDTFSGIAGNMFLAALLDLGLSRRQLDEDLAALFPLAADFAFADFRPALVFLAATGTRTST
jgi:hypothetical protein